MLSLFQKKKILVLLFFSVLSLFAAATAEFPQGLITVSSNIILSDAYTVGLYSSLMSTACLRAVSTLEGCFPLCVVLWLYPSHLLTWLLACGLPASDG